MNNGQKDNHSSEVFMKKLSVDMLSIWRINREVISHRKIFKLIQSVRNEKVRSISLAIIFGEAADSVECEKAK